MKLVFYFLPVYSASPAPTTEADKLNALIGWAYALVVLQESVNKILAKLSFAGALFNPAAEALLGYKKSD